MEKSPQIPFVFREHGGSRKNSGRAKIHAGELPHVRRQRIDARTPMHVTVKMREGIPGLREPQFLYAFTAALKRAAKKGLRIQHFSIQVNHLHLIAEADDNRALRIGMLSLMGSLVWALRRLFKYWGRVFLSRYHLNPIRVPQLMRNVFKYVLFNREHHCGESTIADVYSSVYSFRDIRTFGGQAFIGIPPRWQSMIDESLSEARSWMQTVGWRKAR